MAESKRVAEHWHRLDNTANLFPVISGKNYANVYRLAINLSEPVKGGVLQTALEKVLPWFPAFHVRMRRGLFWHYLEHNPGAPLVLEEDDAPCRYIDPAQNDRFLFRLTYYGCRVNLEVFHVLTDGTGASRFLQAIVCQYLMAVHPKAFSTEEKARRWFAEHADNTQDGYVANYTPTKKSNFKMGRGFALKGERLPLDELDVTHVHIGLDKLKALCKAQGVTVTHYLTACIGWAIYQGAAHGKPPKWPINIFVPVNLRPFFQSETALNFFSNIYITLPFADPNITFDDVLAEVKRQFTDKLHREGMLEKISYTVGSGYSTPIRIVPLPIKKVVLRAVYRASSKSSTISFTNVGVIRMPEQFAPYVSGAHVLLSPSPRNPYQCATLSYGKDLTFSVTSKLAETPITRLLVRCLSADGLAITIETNGARGAE